jgi:hypothetical protein
MRVGRVYREGHREERTGQYIVVPGGEPEPASDDGQRHGMKVAAKRSQLARL